MSVPDDAVAILARLSAMSYFPSGAEEHPSLARRLLATARKHHDSPFHLAASIELASRMLKDAQLHEEAVKLMRPYRRSAGLYFDRLVEPRQPSLSASSIGSWVWREVDPPISSWIAEGLCSHDLVCAEYPTIKTEGKASLQQQAIIRAGTVSGAARNFPFIF